MSAAATPRPDATRPLPGVRRVLAPNPGPMTLDGTCTWVLGGLDGAAVVVDPGPDDGGHLDAVVAAAGDRGVGLVLLTHHHHDHADAAPALAARTGAPVRAVDPAHRLGDEGLPDGDAVDVPGAGVLRVLATPGHTADSVSLVLEGDGPRAVLTGDTVLGRGPTVVAAPDGRLTDYLRSLDRLAGLADAGTALVLPGHGDPLGDLAAAVDALREHRRSRLDQVRAALAAGDRTAGEVVARVYADVDPALHGAAEVSVAAQLEHLREVGEPVPAEDEGST